ncbi:GTPase-activating protein skywalker-like [Oppia nitens]|uniref:GTPase-activating protein skywalker-like n=1 Tax=Oppia nitens TaxID=1686743 RepID=UPI0023DB13B1|nr:GTPase-activating protein skywalker-like [Oppia nitens]
MRLHALTDASLASIGPSTASSSLSLAIIRSSSLRQLKQTIRSLNISINDSIRDDLWRELVAKHSSEDPSEEDLLADIEVSNKLPQFVDPRVSRFFGLKADNYSDVSRILWSLSQNCPHVTYAPLLFPLAAICLHFYDSTTVYRLLYRLLQSRDPHFCSTSRSDATRDAVVLIKLTKRLSFFGGSAVGREARRKLRNSVLDSVFANYLEWIFALPFEHVVRVVDCFLCEGHKFLFRISLSLSILCHQNSCHSLQEVLNLCSNPPISPQKLIQNAISLSRLSRKNISRFSLISKLIQNEQTIQPNLKPLLPDQLNPADWIIGARLAPRSFRSSVLREWALADALWAWLPERVVVREPEVVFCSEENGNSLQTFFTLCGDLEPTVLLVRTLRDDVFGAFCSTAWNRRLDLSGTKSGQYFGTGETFLFVLKPRLNKWEWIGRNQQIQSHSQQLFMSATQTSLCVGSGGGRFGLFIDGSLTRGQSDCCDTFANQSLSSDSKDFDISVVEVIAFT